MPRVIKNLIKELVPQIGRVRTGLMMKYLASTHDSIAGSAKDFRDGLSIGQVRAPPLAIAIDSGSGRSKAGKDGGAGRIAERGCTVCIGEQGAARSESIYVRGSRIGMSVEASDPVVQVIDDKEKYIRIFRIGKPIAWGDEKTRNKKECASDLIESHNSPRFISPTAKSAARAVSAMKVSDGFTHAIEVMQLPSVTNTFFASWTWLCLLRTEVSGS